MSVIANKRLQKELKDLQTNPPVGITLEDTNNLRLWTLILRPPEETVYHGEVFRVQFKFSDNYPLDSPEVIFLGESPVHPHIYSNGHICLSILYDAWSPALTVVSVCLSLLSMLSSCTKKERPPDNATYVVNCKKSPKQTNWYFHGQ